MTQRKSPLGPLPNPPHPNAKPGAQEAHLEKYFSRMVQVLLRGKCIKLAPIERGTPDRLVLLPGGRSELVELKTDHGQLEPAQRVWHARARLLGHDVTVLYGQVGVDAWVAARQPK